MRAVLLPVLLLLLAAQLVERARAESDESLAAVKRIFEYCLLCTLYCKLLAVSFMLFNASLVFRYYFTSQFFRVFPNDGKHLPGARHNDGQQQQSSYCCCCYCTAAACSTGYYYTTVQQYTSTVVQYSTRVLSLCTCCCSLWCVPGVLLYVVQYYDYSAASRLQTLLITLHSAVYPPSLVSRTLVRRST